MSGKERFVRYYKTNHPEVMAAVAELRLAHKVLWTASKAFADEFGGKPYNLRGSHGEHFGGLIFTPKRDKMLWTMPDRHGGQQPRAKPRPGATEAQREEHKALREKWLAMYPKQKVSSDALYAAIGTSWSELLFAGIGYAERDGWLYVETSVALNDRMVEILGGEYQAAFKEAA
jgi:hypothetical protein